MPIIGIYCIIHYVYDQYLQTTFIKKNFIENAGNRQLNGINPPLMKNYLMPYQAFNNIVQKY